MKQKELYAAPVTEVLELRLEANVLQITSPGYQKFNDETEWNS